MNVTLPVYGSDAPDPSAPPPQAPKAVREGGRLVDSHGRTIRDLRLSVTDRCNFRCVYCMDPDIRFMPKRELLTRDEYVRLARICVSLGVEKVRVTGGEPSLYPELEVLLTQLNELPLKDLSITTNGSLLDADRAARWSATGLRRLTLSMDSLRPERVTAITRATTSPQDTIDAIRTAKAAGLGPIKVNAVVMRGFNDDELADFADFAREHAVDMRLIEFMPLDSGRDWKRDAVVSADEMLEHIGSRHDLVQSNGDDPSSTSINFTFADGSPGRIGIIASVTRPFCGACSRLRITADGKIRPCLFSETEWDAKPLLRNCTSDEDIARFLIDATWTKQAGHAISSPTFSPPERTMSAIGG